MSANSFPLVSRQPLRLLYQLFGALGVLFRLPFWCLQALMPGWRPNRAWTFKQTLMANLTHAIVDIYSNVSITETHTLDAGKEGDRFETVEPFEADVYRGPLLSAPDVKPATIGGTWFPAKPASASTGRVFLSIHGGAFVLGDGRTGYSGYMATTLLETAGSADDAVFVPQYRLSSHVGGSQPANPFPAALQDVLTAYLHLTQRLGVASNRIVLVGDSAGGNLVIGLLRFLEAFSAENSSLATKPCCAVLIAPWVDPLSSLGQDRSPTDYLPVSFLRWGARAYAAGTGILEVVSETGATGKADADALLPYIKPLGHPFRTSVPIFVSLGELEMLKPAGAAWAQEMTEEAGCPWVEVSYEANAVHDTLLMGGIIGWDQSARAVGARAGEFIKKAEKPKGDEAV
jgi:acetyl esterase/lipase